MKKISLDELHSLHYANLSEDEENQLRELEKTFNTHYNKAVYFMVMEK